MMFTLQGFQSPVLSVHASGAQTFARGASRRNVGNKLVRRPETDGN
jgi:hypothetical protein